MRKITLTAFFMLVFFTAFAQMQGIKLNKLSPRSNENRQMAKNFAMTAEAMQLDSIVYRSSENNFRNEKMEYTYSGGLITRIKNNWDNTGTPSWKPYSKKEYRFDQYGNEIYNVFYDWIDGVWQPYEKSELTFREDGRPILLSHSEWTNNAWEEYVHMEFQYDATGMMTTSTGFMTMWDGEEEGDDIGTKINVRLEPSGTIRDLVIVFRGEIEGEWIDIQRVTQKYDENMNLLEEFFEEGHNGWEPEYKQTYTYNANNDILTDLYSNYTDGAWVDDSLTENEYDASFNLISVIDSHDNEGQLKKSNKEVFTYEDGRIVSSALYGFSNDVEVPWENGTYYYSVSTDLNTLHVNNTVTIYPNPAAESIQITLSEGKSGELTVYSLNGAVVLSTPINSGSTVPVSHLPKGVLTYKISAEGENHFGKLMIK